MYLGISLTPQALACLVIDSDGKTLASHQTPLGRDAARDPQAWWEALLTLLGLMAKEGLELEHIEAASVSGTPQGAVFVGKDGAVIGRTVLAGDREAQSWVSYHEATARRSRAISGNIAHGDMAGIALLKLRGDEPDLFEKLAWVMTPRDYLVWRLTGRRVTDPTTASSTALFDPVQTCWAERILTPLGLKTDLLAQILSAGEKLGPVTNEARKQTGLNNAHVYNGTSDLDAACLCLGIGAAGDTLVALQERTTVVRPALTFTPNPIRHLDMHAFIGGADTYCHVADVGPARGFDRWARGLGDVSAPRENQNDLYFLPQLEHGGALAGLSPQTAPADIVQAVLYGAAFEIGETLEAMEDLTPAGPRLALLAPPDTGADWGPYLASSLGKDLEVFEDDGFVAARGAALVARSGHADKALSFDAPEPSSRHVPRQDLKAHFDMIRPKIAGLKSRLTH